MRVEGLRPDRKLSAPTSSVGQIAGRLLVLAVIDTFAVWFLFQLFSDGFIWLAVAVIVLTIFLNIVFFREQAYPFRWMAIGLVLMTLFAIYPIIFTIYVAFTNYGDGHILTRQQAIRQLENTTYLPEGGADFTWTAYVRQTAGGPEFALWLQGADGTTYLARPNEPLLIVSPGEEGVGELDENGIPVGIEGYDRLNRLSVVRFVTALGALTFGDEELAVKVRNLDSAAALRPRYVYDPDRDAMIDQSTGTVYTAVEGTFTAPDGSELIPGFQEEIGVENFRRFFTSPALQGPLVRIVIWNFAFALLSVLTTFSLGLFIALIYNDPNFPFKKLIQTFLLVPYTIPSLITILIWRGMLQPRIGIFNKILEAVAVAAPPWFTNPTWAKIGILMINLWLGYPYFMLICSGALQAIPQDIYSAAEVDGASRWQSFWRITLPLLLVAVGPLLVASFTFNFNNFNLIFLYAGGGPPIAGTPTPAGHTDLLISYVYDLAFAGGRGADYGLASAITIIIFLIVATITMFQFRYTRMWEEVSESV